MNEAKINKLKNDYLQGMKYKDIMSKYNITQPELRSLIRKNKWKRSKKSNRNNRYNKQSRK